MSGVATHRLTKTMRRQIEAIREVVSPWGLGTAVVNEGPHMVVKVFAPDGGAHRISISSTPRCRDAAVHFAVQKARRLLRHINERAGY